MFLRQCGYLHISVGELLRQEMANPSSHHSHQINEVVRDGGIVCSTLTVNLLKHAIGSFSPQTPFLIDGFPRNIANADAYLTHLHSYVNLQSVIFLACTEADMLARLDHRAKTSNRSDDNIQSIQKRIVTFKNETLPVVDWLMSYNVKFIKIDATGSIEDVQKKLRWTIDQKEACAS